MDELQHYKAGCFGCGRKQGKGMVPEWRATMSEAAMKKAGVPL